MQDDTSGMDTADKDALTFGVIAGVVTLFVCWVWKRFDDNDLSMSEAYAIAGGGDDARWWFVDHPFKAALIVFAVVTIGFRLYVFIRRLEDRS